MHFMNVILRNVLKKIDNLVTEFEWLILQELRGAISTQQANCYVRRTGADKIIYKGRFAPENADYLFFKFGPLPQNTELHPVCPGGRGQNSHRGRRYQVVKFFTGEVVTR